MATTTHSILIETSCCADPAKLCDRCRADRFAQLRGVAACRGEVWAMDIARRRGRDVAWPTGSEAILAIARLKVDDLARDHELVEQLAGELVRWAERWWSSAPS